MMTQQTALRWGDNDRYFGPFTFAKDSPGSHMCAVVLTSADDEGRPCNLRISIASRTLIVRLPAIIRPHREKVHSRYWTETDSQRLGRDWYWQIDERAYGFSVCEGHLHVKLGRQTHDSSTTQDWGWFLPWTQWRYVRFSLYGLKGEHVWTQVQRGGPRFGFDNAAWEERRQRKAACPSVTFAFDDFDGERLTATTWIEEGEWLAGEGWFRWLSWFRASKVVRVLDITFSGETGRRKGSWKGGVIGTSINMLPGELHESAFRRYCAENGMTFDGDTRETAP